MKELFRELSKEDHSIHRVMASLLEKGVRSKTLVCDHEIVYSCGEKDFFQNNLDIIAGVRTTGVFEIGGREVYCEVLEDIPELIVCGAGHVGVACIRAASFIDMHITCIDDREDFLDAAREAGAHKVIYGRYEDVLDGIEGGDNCFFLAMSRAHTFDEICLEKILQKPFAYVGMLGSSGKINKIRTDLVQKGISEEEFAKVHTPVGLDISANTPEEIAIAVMAEIISVKNTGKMLSSAFDQAQLDAAMNDAGDLMLVTVIRKVMESPRDPGTKMIVTSDGSKWGTIGGGAAEHQAFKIAREHLNDPEFITEIIRVGDESNQAGGLACGGVIDVLFEKL